MPERAQGRALGLIATAALLLAVGTISFIRAARGEWDFSHFYHDARDVWENRTLNPVLDPTGGDNGRRLPFYFPAVPAMIAPLTAFGPRVAAGLWMLIQVGSLAYSLRLVRREWAGSDAAFWLAICLALPALYEAAKFNQLSFPILALTLAAFDGFRGGGTLRTAVPLGLAIVLKLLPGIFVLWLCLKRRWAAASATVAASVVFAVVPAVIAFGPRQAATHYAEWWRFNFEGDSVRGLLGAERREHFTDHRNQSITQVISRWTWEGHPHRMHSQPVQLSVTIGVTVARLASGALLAALLWLSRRSAPQLGPDRLRAEWAVFGIASLVLSPLVRQYYLVWTLPGLAYLAGRAEQPRSARMMAGLAVWTLGMIAWLWPAEAQAEAMRLGGVHLLMLLIVGVVLLCGRETAGTSHDPPRA